MSGMFSLAFWIIRTLKCEAVNFPRFESAGIPVRPFEYIDAPILIIECAPCMHAPNAHAQHDITRFAYDVNHITMTSPAFAFHSCHVETRWHEVIGVHIVGTAHHHGSHCMGMTYMTSPCSHCVRITLMMLSCSGHGIIVTRMNHDCNCSM